MAYKRKTGGETPVKGGKKRSDNSTSYNKKDMTHSGSAKTPSYPYGQPHLKSKPRPKGTANKLK